MISAARLFRLEFPPDHLFDDEQSRLCEVSLGLRLALGLFLGHADYYNLSVSGELDLDGTPLIGKWYLWTPPPDSDLDVPTPVMALKDASVTSRLGVIQRAGYWEVEDELGVGYYALVSDLRPLQ